jgi:hypothetical protein
VVIGSINQLSLCPTRNRKGYSYRAHQPHFGHTPFFDTTVVAIAEHLPASGESDHRAGRMPDRNLAVVVFVITRQARRIRGNKKKGPATRQTAPGGEPLGAPDVVRAVMIDKGLDSL